MFKTKKSNFLVAQTKVRNYFFVKTITCHTVDCFISCLVTHLSGKYSRPERRARAVGAAPIRKGNQLQCFEKSQPA